jgi:hypothetical protein
VTDPTPDRKGGGGVSKEGVRFAVRVVADGRELELKEFLHDVIGGAVHGLLAGLRGVDAPKQLRIDVTRK